MGRRGAEVAEKIITGFGLSVRVSQGSTGRWVNWLYRLAAGRRLLRACVPRVDVGALCLADDPLHLPCRFARPCCHCYYGCKLVRRSRRFRVRSGSLLGWRSGVWRQSVAGRLAEVITELNETIAAQSALIGVPFLNLEDIS